jgi:hypothetical protein
MSDMDGERNLFAPRGQQLHTCILVHVAAYLATSFKKAVAWPPRALRSVTAKGMKRMSGRLFTPSEYFSDYVSSARMRATS